jgi:CYTH domain-containing protein
VECWLLEAELEDLHQPVALPSFVGEAREVTDEPGYTNAALARRHRRR